jgi:hypothetical protein
MDRHSRAVALSTSLNIVWVVTTATSTVWTDNFSIVRDIKRLAIVKLFKRELDFDAYPGSSLFLLLTKENCYRSKHFKVLIATYTSKRPLTQIQTCLQMDHALLADSKPLRHPGRTFVAYQGLQAPH